MLLQALGRGDDTVGDPRRAQISRFEFLFRAQIYEFDIFELILSSKLDQQFPVEQFEASRAIRDSGISVSSTLPPSRK